VLLLATILFAVAFGTGLLAVYQILVRDRDPVVARLRDPEADTEDRASRVLRWLGPGVVESVVASLADGKATPSARGSARRVPSWCSWVPRYSWRSPVD